jgi:hypothetical protein
VVQDARLRLPSGKSLTCEVTAFSLDVATHFDDLKETDERARPWLPLAETARIAADRGSGRFGTS